MEKEISGETEDLITNKSIYLAVIHRGDGSKFQLQTSGFEPIQFHIQSQ